ncbi:MAG: hypothetical protein ACRBCL_06500 [Maritimibacter sp.]
MSLIIATFAVVKPAMGPGVSTSIKLTGASPTALFLIAMGLWLLFDRAGLAACVGIVSAYGLHELGRIIGYRIVGHETLSFRLLRLPRAGRNSDRPFASDLEAFFVTLMGPALGLAPMVAFFAAAQWASGSWSKEVHEGLAMVAFMIGAFNFAALMPIYPMDGAKLLHLLTRAMFNRISKLPTLVFLLAVMALGWSIQAPLLFLISVAGALAYAARSPLPDRPRMSKRPAFMAATAMLALICAYFLGGWWIILLVTSGF